METSLPPSVNNEIDTFKTVKNNQDFIVNSMAKKVATPLSYFNNYEIGNTNIKFNNDSKNVAASLVYCEQDNNSFETIDDDRDLDYNLSDYSGESDSTSNSDNTDNEESNEDLLINVNFYENSNKPFKRPIKNCLEGSIIFPNAIIKETAEKLKVS